jgi:mannose-6-phosphate isomerase-like protein (cupin superfamily)
MKLSVIDSSQGKVKSFNPIQFQELLSAENSEEISIAIITLKGTNRKIRHTVSNTFYFVLEGEGAFTIEGKKHVVKKYDLVAIPKGTVYFDSGNMKMLSVCHPRFDPATVEYPA